MERTKDIFFSVLKPVSVASTLLKLVSVPIGIVNARLMADVVDSATHGDYREVINNSLTILAILLVFNIFDLVTGYLYQKKVSNSLHTCKMLLYKRYLSSPLDFLYRSTAGEAGVVLNSDFGKVTSKYVDLYPSLISTVVTIVAYLAYLCIQFPILAGIMLGVSVIQIIPPLYIRFFCGKLDTSCKETEGQISNCALECYNGFATIKLFDLTAWSMGRMKLLHRKMRKIADRLQATYRTETAISGVVSNALTYGTYAIVGLFVITKHITVEAGIQAIALSGSLYSSVSSMFGLIPEFELVRVAEKRMSRFGAESKKNDLLSDNTDVRFKKVSCTLGDKQILNEADLSIDSDGITVFRGVNGAGKSTIVRLLLGIVNCDGGDICVGGVAPKDIGYDNFPHKIFYLTQEDPPYNLTPGELFGMVLDEAASETAFAVLGMFNIGEGILSQTIGSLSGGERKKVFLSLAFACDPQLMILDEPTNSLDKNGCDILRSLLSERTRGTIIITHEESLTDLAKTVYEVGEGRVIREK